MRRVLAIVLLVLFVMMGMASLAHDEVFRIAALMPSATNDLAFSQSMYDALVAIQEELGAEAFEFTVQDSTYIVDDAAVALRDWAASGDFQLVIAHGSQYGPIVEELAAEFTDVSFAWERGKTPSAWTMSTAMPPPQTKAGISMACWLRA